MDFRSYRDLQVWQKAMELAVDAYAISRSFPDSERFGRVSQFQRSGASIPADIAEGHAFGLPKPFLRHLRIALGSLAETETHLLLAEKLGYIDHSRTRQFLEHAAEIRRMLFGLKTSLQRRIQTETDTIG